MEKVEKILYSVYTEKGYQYGVPSHVSENYIEASDTWQKMVANGELAFLKCEVITEYDRLQKELEETARMADAMALYGAI